MLRTLSLETPGGLSMGVDVGHWLLATRSETQARLYTFVQPEPAPLANTTIGATHALLFGPNSNNKPFMRGLLREALDSKGLDIDFGNSIHIEWVGPYYANNPPIAYMLFTYETTKPDIVRGPRLSDVMKQTENLVIPPKEDYTLRKLTKPI